MIVLIKGALVLDRLALARSKQPAMFRGTFLSAFLAIVWLFAAAAGAIGCATAQDVAPADIEMSHVDHVDGHCEAQCLSSAPLRLNAEDRADDASHMALFAPALDIVIARLVVPESRDGPPHLFRGDPETSLHDIRTVRLLI